MWQSKIQRQMEVEARASREAAVQRAQPVTSNAALADDKDLPLNEYYAYYSDRHEYHYGADFLGMTDGTNKKVTCISRSSKWADDNYAWPDKVYIGTVFMVGMSQQSDNYCFQTSRGWVIP